MEENRESKEKKEMAGKAAASVVGVAAFAGATAVGIDVLGEESADELVAVNPVSDGAAEGADPDQLLAYESSAGTAHVAAGELEIIRDSEDMPSAEAEVHLSADAAEESYLPEANVQIDSDLEGLLASADTGDTGFMDGVIDVVGDLV